LPSQDGRLAIEEISSNLVNAFYHDGVLVTPNLQVGSDTHVSYPLVIQPNGTIFFEKQCDEFQLV